MNFEEKTLVIAFTGLARYRLISAQCSNGEMFNIVAELSELIGGAVERAGGHLVKLMGDEAFIAFEESQAAHAVAALRSLKVKVDKWLVSHKLESEMLIRVNVGKVAVGKIGPENDKRMDIIGRVVNDTAMLSQGSFVVGPKLEKILAS